MLNIYDFFFSKLLSPHECLAPISTDGEPHLLLSLLVLEEYPMPHHLPPLPPAHSLGLPLPCPVHLLPYYPLSPSVGCTSPTPNIPEPAQQTFR